MDHQTTGKKEKGIRGDTMSSFGEGQRGQMKKGLEESMEGIKMNIRMKRIRIRIFMNLINNKEVKLKRRRSLATKKMQMPN